MKKHSALNWLVPPIALFALFALVAAGAGLFLKTEGSSYTFATLFGATAQIYGRGLYAHDTIFSAGASQGADNCCALYCPAPAHHFFHTVSARFFTRWFIAGKRPGLLSLLWRLAGTHRSLQQPVSSLFGVVLRELLCLCAVLYDF